MQLTGQNLNNEHAQCDMSMDINFIGSDASDFSVYFLFSAVTNYFADQCFYFITHLLAVHLNVAHFYLYCQQLVLITKLSMSSWQIKNNNKFLFSNFFNCKKSCLSKNTSHCINHAVMIYFLSCHVSDTNTVLYKYEVVNPSTAF